MKATEKKKSNYFFFGIVKIISSSLKVFPLMKQHYLICNTRQSNVLTCSFFCTLRHMEPVFHQWHLFGQYNFIPAVHIRFSLLLSQYFSTLLSQYFLRLLVMSAPVSSSGRDSNTMSSEAARICNAQKDYEVFGLCSTQKLKVLQILPPLLYRVKRQAVSVQGRQKYLHSPFLKPSLFRKGYLYILILQHGERLEEAFF